MIDVLFVDSIDLEHNYCNNIQLGILSLATILQKNHFCVKYVNNEYLKHNVNISKDEKFENIIDIISYHIINLNPKVISFYTICNTYHITIILSKRIKELNPNIRIVFGGPQATLTANDTMNSCKWVDAIGIGEGEKTIINIINFLISNDVKKCKSGIVYRKDNKVINLHQENIIPDLDKLPLIDYSDILDNNNITQISLDVGRGCPFSCKFCSTKTFWKRKFRLKSCDRIIKEIMDIKKKNNNIKFFRFEHDLFTADRTKIIDFCNKILDMKINIKWSCSARIDTLDELMIEKMYTAGCREIFLGIESGSSRIQQIINKNLDLKYAFDIIEIIKKYDIFLTTSFMYGFPEEELIDVDKTLIFIIKLIRLGVNQIQAHPLSILPGTEYFKEYKRELFFEDNDINDYLDLECSFNKSKIVQETIKNNPNLFPQYYTLKSEIIYKTRYLDIYIYNFLPIFMNIYFTTYSLLKHFFSNDINIFLAFKEENINYFKQCNSLSDSKDARNILIESFITKYDFGLDSEKIRTCFKLEKLLFKK